MKGRVPFLLGRSMGLLLLAGFVSGRAAGQVPRYPAWFLTMPEHSEQTWAVGYAPVYAYPASALAEADSVARQQLGLAVRADVVGEQLFEALPRGQVAYRGALFRVAGPPAEAVRPVPVDTARVNGMVLLLVGSVPGRAVVDAVVSVPRTAPPWVTDLSGLDDGLYAVGGAPLYYYEHHAWLEAERQARQQLAFNARTQQRHLRRGTRTMQTGVTATSTAVTLRGAQVVARWRNERMCFVLMRAAAAEVVAPGTP